MPTSLEVDLNTRSGLSTIDDVGALFIQKETVQRGINQKFVQDIKRLLDCGLIQELIALKLFPATQISAVKIANYPLVIQHAKIQPMIYPFEWSPEMVRKAALSILQVNEMANSYGYQIKDCHPYNVAFQYNQPMFLDLGSFIKWEPGSRWQAQREFERCYEQALKLVHRGMRSFFSHAYLLRGNGLDPIDLNMATSRIYGLLGRDLTKSLSEPLPRLKRKLAKRFAKLKRRISGSVQEQASSTPTPLNLAPPNYAQLRKNIAALNLTGRSLWSNYHDRLGFYDEAGGIQLSSRMQWVAEKTKKLTPSTILELGGNQGILSRQLSKFEGVDSVICSDYDQHAIDALLLRSDPNERVSLACFDVMSGIHERLTHERAARLQSDLVLALALTHHLTITQGYALSVILETIKKYATKHVIIEFMPLGLWANGSGYPVPAWYNEEWFKSHFEESFKFLERVKLEENRIAYVGAV
jgi:hypothetical protein